MGPWVPRQVPQALGISGARVGALRIDGDCPGISLADTGAWAHGPEGRQTSHTPQSRTTQGRPWLGLGMEVGRRDDSLGITSGGKNETGRASAGKNASH